MHEQIERVKHLIKKQSVKKRSEEDSLISGLLYKHCNGIKIEKTLFKVLISKNAR